MDQALAARAVGPAGPLPAHACSTRPLVPPRPAPPRPSGVLAYLGGDKALTQIELPGTSIKLTGAFANLVYKR